MVGVIKHPRVHSATANRYNKKARAGSIADSSQAAALQSM